MHFAVQASGLISTGLDSQVLGQQEANRSTGIEKVQRSQWITKTGVFCCRRPVVCRRNCPDSSGVKLVMRKCWQVHQNLFFFNSLNSESPDDARILNRVRVIDHHSDSRRSIRFRFTAFRSIRSLRDPEL